MVVVSPLGAAFRIAARPDAHIHSVDGSALFGERVASEELLRGSLVDPSFVQRGVQAGPAPAMHTLEAQVNR